MAFPRLYLPKTLSRSSFWPLFTVWGPFPRPQCIMDLCAAYPNEPHSQTRHIWSFGERESPSTRLQLSNEPSRTQSDRYSQFEVIFLLRTHHHPSGEMIASSNFGLSPNVYRHQFQISRERYNDSLFISSLRNLCRPSWHQSIKLEVYFLVWGAQNHIFARVQLTSSYLISHRVISRRRRSLIPSPHG